MSPSRRTSDAARHGEASSASRNVQLFTIYDMAPIKQAPPCLRPPQSGMQDPDCSARPTPAATASIRCFFVNIPRLHIFKEFCRRPVPRVASLTTRHIHARRRENCRRDSKEVARVRGSRYVVALQSVQVSVMRCRRRAPFSPPPTRPRGSRPPPQRNQNAARRYAARRLRYAPRWRKATRYGFSGARIRAPPH